MEIFDHIFAWTLRKLSKISGEVEDRRAQHAKGVETCRENKLRGAVPCCGSVRLGPLLERGIRRVRVYETKDIIFCGHNLYSFRDFQ